MNSFAFYRFPRQEHYTRLCLTEGEPEELFTLEQLNGRRGFVLAPFVVSDDCPILLFPEERPLKSEKGCLSEEVCLNLGGCEVTRTTPNPSFMKGGDFAGGGSLKGGEPQYALAFARFHAALRAGQFAKLVLARSQVVSTNGCNPLALFQQACLRYPRMFVALVSAPRCGTWLMATPEVLLRHSEGQHYETMALAGTMKLEGELLQFDNPSQSLVQQIRWSQKNIQEQRFVANYISNRLKDFATDIDEAGPYTTRAANLVHLRSDFRFTLHADCGIGSLLEALHPTPAVCGLPKAEARDFILANECQPRLYYSGFCGPLDQALYVSLRCMQISENHCRLYAGGGLLPDSIEQQEWEETEAKMQTMRTLL